jgi:hypothetical protein
MLPSSSDKDRKGAVVVLAALLMIILFACVAWAVDLGYLYVVSSEAQRCADSAALAGAWAMASEQHVVNRTTGNYDLAREAAIQFGSLNRVNGAGFKFDANWSNGADGDIVLGRLDDPADRDEQLSLWDPNRYNTVRVRVRCLEKRDNAVPLFFARVLGFNTAEITAEAAAYFDSGNVAGFRPTQNTGNALLLPFAVKLEVWEDFLDGHSDSDDRWTHDSEAQTVSRGSDGKPELKIFPGDRSDLTSGNFGTVNVGGNNNSTSVLEGQIRDGISATDLAPHGGELRLNQVTGDLPLNGDPGISVGIKEALGDVVGQARSIFLYDEVTGQGNTTYFNIVGFAGIRVMDFSLAGNKYVLVQPALVVDRTAIINTDGSTTSYFVGQPPRLVR